MASDMMHGDFIAHERGSALHRAIQRMIVLERERDHARAAVSRLRALRCARMMLAAAAGGALVAGGYLWLIG